MPVPVPPLAEQRRIVAEIEKHVTLLDAAVAALQRAKANIQRCRVSATEAAFAPYSAAQIRRLGELGEIVGGLTKGQKRKPGTKIRLVPYLRVANVQRGYLNLDNIKLIEATDEDIRSLQLLSGDVLLNEGGDRDKLGRGWIWEGQITECIHQNHVFRVRLNPLLAVPRFVSYYANHFGQRYFFKEGKQTTNLASINMTKLRELPIPLPTVGEQEKVISNLEDHLSILDSLDHSIVANLRRAANLRQAILKKALEGTLVPQDPNDEPASVLLERIRAARAQTATRRAPQKRETYA
jgi:type I restriction enzyme S subunit